MYAASRDSVLVTALWLVTSVPLPAQNTAAARASLGVVTLPTYEVDAPDPNPPFDAFTSPGNAVYPYAVRDRLSDRRSSRSWRAIILENDYLRCTVLPDLGGRLYSCIDRISGEEMFYANRSIKFVDASARGAWPAVGVEFNFPVAQGWMTASPADFTFADAADGSASAWVGGVDRAYGMSWQVKLTLRAGRAALEQETTLYNGSDVRRRYFWWTNAAVRAWSDTRILLPQKYVATPGFSTVETWPVDRNGVDLSMVGNLSHGAVSFYSAGSREPYMAVYHPRSETGVAHYSSFSDAPFKMVHSWGGDASAADWRHALSDDSSSYVEMQAGLFRNRETYGFLEPQDRLSFTEYWIPLRGTGGLTRATPEAALRVSRIADSTGLAIDVALNVTHAMPNARVELRSGARVLESEGMALSPEHTLLRRWTIARGSPPLTVSVRDGRAMVIQHTEGVFDFANDSLIKTGAQPSRQVPLAANRTATDWVDDAEEKEMGGDYGGALESFCLALALKPQSAAILRSAGRLAVTLRRFRMADSLLQRAWSQTSSDPETAYYLALSRLALGDTVRARPLLNIARRSRVVQTAANFSLASLDAQAGIFRAAIDHLSEGLANAPGASRLLAASAVLLRALGDSAATPMLDRALAANPLALLARYEKMRLTSVDTSLLSHLASDPERILTVATDYMGFGLYDAALEVLERSYQTTGLVVDAGSPHPSQYPLIAYYRGYVKERLGRSPAADYAAASKMSGVYVFPSRDEDVRVLRSAVAFNARDALGHLLLGHLAMAGDDADTAIEHWERARSLNARLPALHRNLGLAYLLKGEPSSAQRVLNEGLRYDSLNAAIYLALDSLAETRHQALEARIRNLSRYPAKSSMPSPLVFRLARLLAAAGQFDAAESLFKGRYFARSAVGENATSVWMEVRMSRAEQLAKSGKCGDGMQMLTSIVQPVDGLRFRSEALVAEVSRTPMADWSARLLQQCASATGAGPRAKTVKVSETPRPPGTRK